MEFNSLDAQREACEAYIASQKPEGWVLVPDRYDDGGWSGATLERPALKRLIADIDDSRVDVVVVYKIDRLSRSLMDFSKLVEVFDGHAVDVAAFQFCEEVCHSPTLHSLREKAARGFAIVLVIGV
jgi:DNA invertase Pin-like site-specific DNA recombinase